MFGKLVSCLLLIILVALVEWLRLSISNRKARVQIRVKTKILLLPFWMHHLFCKLVSCLLVIVRVLLVECLRLLPSNRKARVQIRVKTKIFVFAFLDVSCVLPAKFLIGDCCSIIGRVVKALVFESESQGSNLGQDKCFRFCIC